MWLLLCGEAGRWTEPYPGHLTGCHWCLLGCKHSQSWHRGVSLKLKWHDASQLPTAAPKESFSFSSYLASVMPPGNNRACWPQWNHGSHDWWIKSERRVNPPVRQGEAATSSGWSPKSGAPWRNSTGFWRDLIKISQSTWDLTILQQAGTTAGHFVALTGAASSHFASHSETGCAIPELMARFLLIEVVFESILHKGIFNEITSCVLGSVGAGVHCPSEVFSNPRVLKMKVQIKQQKTT